jgi:hypothetical protein
MKLGYLKDSIAVVFFIIVLIKLYYLSSKNVSNFKNEISIYIFLAFLLDAMYTLHPEMHCKEFALNDNGTIYLIFIYSIGLITFTYFNIIL